MASQRLRDGLQIRLCGIVEEYPRAGRGCGHGVSSRAFGKTVLPPAYRAGIFCKYRAHSFRASSGCWIIVNPSPQPVPCPVPSMRLQPDGVCRPGFPGHRRSTKSRRPYRGGGILHSRRGGVKPLLAGYSSLSWQNSAIFVFSRSAFTGLGRQPLNPLLRMRRISSG